MNVPPDATERELVLFFKSAGTVEKVVFDGDGEEEAEENLDDDDETSNEGEDEEGEGEEDGEESQPHKKRKTAKGAAKPAAPEVVPLPSRPTRTFRKTGGTAHVVFTDESSVPRALTPTKKDRPWPNDPESAIGLAHYSALHAALRPPLDVIKAHADSYMALFDYEQAKKKQESKYRKGEAIVDEDGFTLVTRGGAYGQTVGGGVGVASKEFQNEVRRGGASKRNRTKKKDPMEKEAFYAFQIHEKKRNGMSFLSSGTRMLMQSNRSHRAQEEVGRGQGKGGEVEIVPEIQALLNVLFSRRCLSNHIIIPSLHAEYLKSLVISTDERCIGNSHSSLTE